MKTGCAWRSLPRDFPPRSTVWRFFDEWRHNGTLELIHDVLREKVREAGGRDPTPSAGGIDSQSVDSPAGGEEQGRDGHENVNGRERHILVDTTGLLLAVPVTAASADDGRAAPRLLDRAGPGESPRLRLVWGDNKYHNHALYDRVREERADRVEVVSRPPGSGGGRGCPGGGWRGGRSRGSCGSGGCGATTRRRCCRRSRWSAQA